MKVKELKKLLKNVPDDYDIRTRAENAHLNQDEISWQLNFSGVITKVKVVDIHDTVVLIRGHE